MAEPNSINRKPLTKRHLAFVEAYMAHGGNVAAASREAGYSANHGYDLMKNPEIVGEIREREALKTASLNAQVEGAGLGPLNLLKGVGALAFSSIKNYVTDDEGNVGLSAEADDSAWQAVKSIKTTIRTQGRGEDRETIKTVELALWDKPASQRTLAQFWKLLTDKVETSQPLGSSTEASVEDLRAELKAIVSAGLKRAQDAKKKGKQK